MPRYRASWALPSWAAMMDASTACTPRPERGVCSSCPNNIRLKNHATDDTCPRGTTVARGRHVGDLVLLWKASDNVIFAAAGTQQYPWCSSCATSECRLTTTLRSNAASDAVSAGEWTSFSRCTPCGRQCTSHPHTNLMASSATTYSATHTVIDPCGWYTTTFPCSTAPPSCSEEPATCKSCGTLCNLTTSGTRLTSASGPYPLAPARRWPTPPVPIPCCTPCRTPPMPHV